MKVLVQNVHVERVYVFVCPPAGADHGPQPTPASNPPEKNQEAGSKIVSSIAEGAVRGLLYGSGVFG